MNRWYVAKQAAGKAVHVVTDGGDETTATNSASVARAAYARLVGKRLSISALTFGFAYATDPA